MRILITGRAGFIGSHIADRLRGDGHDVVLLDALLPQAHGAIEPDRDGDLVHGDVRDADLLGACCVGWTPCVTRRPWSGTVSTRPTPGLRGPQRPRYRGAAGRHARRRGAPVGARRFDGGPRRGPPQHTEAVRDVLVAEPGATHVAVLPGIAVQPVGDVVEADVAREAVDGLLGRLCELGIDRDGGVTLEAIDTTLSDRADAAEEAAPGDGSDAVIVSRAHGTRRIYQLNPEGVTALSAWLDGVWGEALAGFHKAADAAADLHPDPGQERPFPSLWCPAGGTIRLTTHSKPPSC